VASGSCTKVTRSLWWWMFRLQVR